MRHKLCHNNRYIHGIIYDQTNDNFLGKTGTKLTCKCKGEKCKWKNDFKKVVNGKKTATFKCE